MIANHIHQALEQVRELKQKVLEKQRFKGYSGRARAMAGTVALLAAMFMATDLYPRTILAHIFGWGTVFVIAILLNYGALFYWFCFDPAVKRDLRKLKPALEIVPSLFAGAILTFAFIQHGQHDLLCGMWMVLYGVANLATRHVVPWAISLVGLFYVICGTACLLMPNLTFLNPWPMGIIFFVGEWMGGTILHFDGVPSFPFKKFFKENSDEHEE